MELRHFRSMNIYIGKTNNFSGVNENAGLENSGLID